MIGSRLLDLRSGARGLVVGLNGEEPRPAQRSLARARISTGPPAAGRAPIPRWAAAGAVSSTSDTTGAMSTRPRCRTVTSSTISTCLPAWTIASATPWSLGGAISYSDTHSDYEQSLGKVKAATTGVAGYGTWYSDNWYVDGFLAWGAVDYDSTRNIYIPSNSPAFPRSTPSATAKPKGDQWSASIGVGANYPMGEMTITPTARLGIHLGARTRPSRRRARQWSRAGRRCAHHRVVAVGAGSEAFRRHEHVDRACSGRTSPRNGSTSSRTTAPSIVSKYVNDPFNTIFAIPTAGPTRNYAVLAIGSSATFPDNFSAFAQFSAALGLENETMYGVVLGVAQAVLGPQNHGGRQSRSCRLGAARRIAALMATALAACATPAERFERRGDRAGIRSDQSAGEGFHHRAYMAGCAGRLPTRCTSTSNMTARPGSPRKSRTTRRHARRSRSS